jgi:SAM-dependent methyltransferase
VAGLRMRRDIQPEILDRLPVDDPRAIQSRRDLQKVNAFMGHVGLLTRALRATQPAPRRVVELGAGDGTLLLRVAKRLGRLQTRVQAVLVDLHPSVSAETRSAFQTLGWDVDAQKADVFDWLLQPPAERSDVVLANLFLHHFHDAELSTLLAAASRRASHFIACEPERSRTGLAGASLLLLIGCNDVTRHDARISVRAGFSDREISALWPNESGWNLTESPAGLFSHFFEAKRVARRDNVGW